MPLFALKVPSEYRRALIRLSPTLVWRSPSRTRRVRMSKTPLCRLPYSAGKPPVSRVIPSIVSMSTMLKSPPAKSR